MSYTPDVRDIVWISLDAPPGREQAGRRPFLVLSPRAYNAKTSLMVGCAITSRVKGYPFEVALPPNDDLSGVVLADHVKSLDWRARHATFARRASPSVHDATRNLLGLLLGLSPESV